MNINVEEMEQMQILFTPNRKNFQDKISPQHRTNNMLSESLHEEKENLPPRSLSHPVELKISETIPHFLSQASNNSTTSSITSPPPNVNITPAPTIPVDLRYTRDFSHAVAVWRSKLQQPIAPGTVAMPTRTANCETSFALPGMFHPGYFPHFFVPPTTAPLPPGFPLGMTYLPFTTNRDGNTEK